MNLTEIINSLFSKRTEIAQLANFQNERFYKPYIGHQIAICDKITDILRESKIVTEDYSSVNQTFVTRYVDENKTVASVQHFDGYSFRPINIKIHCDFNIDKKSNIYKDYDNFHRQTCEITGLISQIAYQITKSEHVLYLTLDNCSAKLVDENWFTQEYLGLPLKTKEHIAERARISYEEKIKKDRQLKFEKATKEKKAKTRTITFIVFIILIFLIIRACS